MSHLLILLAKFLLLFLDILLLSNFTLGFIYNYKYTSSNPELFVVLIISSIFATILLIGINLFVFGFIKFYSNNYK